MDDPFGFITRFLATWIALDILVYLLVVFRIRVV